MASLAQLLEQNPNLSVTATNKIKCSVTGHEMPCHRPDIVLQYLNSSRVKKAKNWYSFDFSKYLPYIVQDSKNSLKLFCKLTKLTLNKVPAEVDKHCNGKKFLRLKNDYEKKRSVSAEPAPSTEDDEIWVPPDDLLNDEDEAVVPPKGKKKKIARKGTCRIFVETDDDEDELQVPYDDDDDDDGNMNIADNDNGDDDEFEDAKNDEPIKRVDLITKKARKRGENLHKRKDEAEEFVPSSAGASGRKRPTSVGGRDTKKIKSLSLRKKTKVA